MATRAKRLKAAIVRQPDGTSDLLIVYKDVKAWPKGFKRFEMLEHNGRTDLEIEAFGVRLPVKMCLHVYADVPEDLVEYMTAEIRRKSGHIPEKLTKDENSRMVQDEQALSGRPEKEVLRGRRNRQPYGRKIEAIGRPDSPTGDRRDDIESGGVPGVVGD